MGDLTLFERGLICLALGLALLGCTWFIATRPDPLADEYDALRKRVRKEVDEDPDTDHDYWDAEDEGRRELIRSLREKREQLHRRIPWGCTLFFVAGFSFFGVGIFALAVVLFRALF